MTEPKWIGDRVQVDPDHNPDYYMGLDDEIPIQLDIIECDNCEQEAGEYVLLEVTISLKPYSLVAIPGYTNTLACICRSCFESLQGKKELLDHLWPAHPPKFRERA